MRDHYRYAFWRWQDIPDGRDNAVYLRKLYLIRTPLFQVSLHWIRRPDPGRDLHDHPRNFVSVILRGAYAEESPRGSEPLWIELEDGRPHMNTRWTIRRQGSVAYRRATDPHRIAMVSPDTLTLVLWGPKRRPWGFHTPRGWVGWRIYTGAGQELPR
jgi:hypothetical protein